MWAESMGGWYASGHQRQPGFRRAERDAGAPMDRAGQAGEVLPAGGMRGVNRRMPRSSQDSRDIGGDGRVNTNGVEMPPAALIEMFQAVAGQPVRKARPTG